MFNLFNRLPAAPAGYFPITTDIHSHILPGIDDGAGDVETSISLVRGLMALGFTASIATPHVISDMYRNTPETIYAALARLRAALKKERLKFRVSAAAEYMLDNYFFEMLERGDPLLTVKGKHLLTEFSFGYKPDNPKEMSFKIITAGYIPILAHPERYGFFHNNYDAYHQLQELGFKLQVNLLSLTGYYGKPVARAARYILEQGLVAFVATDMHHERHLAALTHERSRRLFYKYLGERKWNAGM